MQESVCLCAHLIFMEKRKQMKKFKDKGKVIFLQY